MAVKSTLKEFPKSAKPGRTSPYAKFYGDWFDGDIWTLSQSEDFPKAKLASMSSILRAAVKSTKGDTWKLRVHPDTESGTLLIQAYDSAKS
jgi:hypothetical protein